MFATLENERAVQRAAAGDQQAWEQLVREYGGRLRAIAASFRLSRSDAEDATQITWMNLVANARTLRSHDRIGAWLATTMRRNCLRILQRNRREMPTDGLATTVADDSADVEMALLTAERKRLLWQTVGRLPPRQAHLVHALFADARQSYHEITSALSMPAGAIGPIRGRALRRLARLIGETGTGPGELRPST
jgi:RNA polymerase sigma factor (sigma-70 family)